MEDFGKYAYYDKWIFFVIEALSCLDRMSMRWAHLPSAGGYYDQDELIMEIWEAIRLEYNEITNDEIFMDSIKGK